MTGWADDDRGGGSARPAIEEAAGGVRAVAVPAPTRPGDVQAGEALVWPRGPAAGSAR